MSAVVAFQIIFGLIALSMVSGFVLYKARFVVWSGYFRAVIVCEDGDVITRTMRLKKSDTEFTAIVKGSMDTYGIIAKEDTDLTELKKTVKKPGELEKESPNPIKNESNRRIMRQGKFRIPWALYNAHQYEPIDVQNLRKYSLVSATRHRELARNTVTSQLLNAFQENPLKEAMAILLLGGVMLLGLFMLGYFLNSRIDEILNQVGG